MIKESNSRRRYTNVNICFIYICVYIYIYIYIHTPIIKALKYIKQMLTDIKGEADSNTIM